MNKGEKALRDINNWIESKMYYHYTLAKNKMLEEMELSELMENPKAFKELEERLRIKKLEGGEKVNLQDRPYLEVEVVEVKTKKKKEIPERCVGCRLVKTCVGIEKEREKEQQSNGNWVNGENLSKIKFPCACTYSYMGRRLCGILASGFLADNYEYILQRINSQDNCSVVSRGNSLKELIEAYDIHIEKAKIVIFKEIK